MVTGSSRCLRKAVMSPCVDYGNTTGHSLITMSSLTDLKQANEQVAPILFVDSALDREQPNTSTPFKLRHSRHYSP